MEADVAVEECEHQLQDLNMVSVRTQRPLKLLFKPHDFSGGTYISEADASASGSITADATGTAVKAVSIAGSAHVLLHVVKFYSPNMLS
jgi:hypothetical protein